MSVEKMSTYVGYCNRLAKSYPEPATVRRRWDKGWEPVAEALPVQARNPGASEATELTGRLSPHLFEIKRVENTRPVNSGTVRSRAANGGLSLIPTSGRDWNGTR